MNRLSRGSVAWFSCSILAVWNLAGPAPAAEPAAKDLVPCADRALRGFMVRSVDPVPDHPELRRAAFGCFALPVPYIVHSQWDWGDCTARAILDWSYLREMTGEQTFGRDVENGERAALLWLLVPETGMVCVPDRSKPQQGIYHYEMWDQGRTLRALVLMWKTQTDRARKDDLRRRIDKMVAGLSALAARGRDDKYGPFAGYPSDSVAGEQRWNDLWCLRGGQLIEPIADYWAVTRGEANRKFLDELIAGVLSGREGEHHGETNRRWFIFGENGSFQGHFHAHISTASGIAQHGMDLYRAGETARGLELLKWAKRVYDWTLSPQNVNAGATWGWFPERTDLDNKDAREHAELCCVADMIEFAAVLAEAATLDPSLADWDALWDHVERYTINGILPIQFVPNERYKSLLQKTLARRPVIRNAYVEFEVDSAGCFDHEAVAHQTLRTDTFGSLSQMVYGVEYDGRRAWFSHAGGQPATPHGLSVERPCARDGETLKGAVRTQDGAVRIETSAACGQGPYVIRSLRVMNANTADLQHVRVFLAANLDSRIYSQERATAGPRRGRAIVQCSGAPEFVAAAADGPVDFLSVDAPHVLLGEGSFDWHKPRQSYDGNGAAAFGWELGTLKPGESRTVAVTLAVASDADELERALAHQPFAAKATPGGYIEPASNAVNRLTGSWVALYFPEDLIYPGSDGMPNICLSGCCGYSGPRGLYAGWKPVVATKGKDLLVRLPISRKSPDLEQVVTEGQNLVTQQITVLTDRRLRVRIPDWVEPAKVQAERVGGVRAEFTSQGRWLDFGNIAAGASLIIRYPLLTRTTVERVGGSGSSAGFSPAGQKRTFTATWRGNRVIRLDPNGKQLPVFPEE